MIDLPALYQACAPQVHARTMEAVVRVESGGRVLALNVNKLRVQPPRPGTVDEAVQTAEAWISRGYSVDIGLAQINSRNLPGLGLTVRSVLEPCTNLGAGAVILTACYERALRSLIPAGDRALTAALSCYNTGDLQRGVTIGYVSKYGIVPAATRPMVVQASLAATPRAVPARPVDPRSAIAEVPPEWHAAVALTLGGLP